MKNIEVTADQMNTIMVEIQNGITKENSKLKLTPAMIDFWNKVEPQINDIKKKGHVLDIFPEIP